MSLRFAGYAAVFDRVDRGGDVIRAGAFDVSGSVPLLWHHRGAPVGVVERVEPDARGLRVIGRIDDPALAGMVRGGGVSGEPGGAADAAARAGARDRGLRFHQPAVTPGPKGCRHAELVSASTVQQAQSGLAEGWILKQVQDDGRFWRTLAKARGPEARELQAAVMLNSFQHPPGDKDGPDSLRAGS
jgi:hypothetical protein